MVVKMAWSSAMDAFWLVFTSLIYYNIILHYTTTVQTGRQATRHCHYYTAVPLYTTTIQTTHH